MSQLGEISLRYAYPYDFELDCDTAPEEPEKILRLQVAYSHDEAVLANLGELKQLRQLRDQDPEFAARADVLDMMEHWIRYQTAPTLHGESPEGVVGAYFDLTDDYHDRMLKHFVGELGLDEAVGVRWGEGEYYLGALKNVVIERQTVYTLGDGSPGAVYFSAHRPKEVPLIADLY